MLRTKNRAPGLSFPACSVDSLAHLILEGLGQGRALPRSVTHLLTHWMFSVHSVWGGMVSKEGPGGAGGFRAVWGHAARCDLS